MKLGQTIKIDPTLKYIHEGLLFTPPDKDLYIDSISEYYIDTHKFIVYGLQEYKLFHDLDQDVWILLKNLFNVMLEEGTEPFFLSNDNLNLEGDSTYTYEPLTEPYVYTLRTETLKGSSTTQLMERIYSRKAETEEFVISTLNDSELSFSVGIKILKSQIS